MNDYRDWDYQDMLEAEKPWVKTYSGGQPQYTTPEEPEPVAWIQQVIGDLHALHDTELIREVDSGDALIRLDDAIAAVEEAAQRHTAPRQWQGLTDDEIMEPWPFENRVAFARWLEAKLKEKNT